MIFRILIWQRLGVKIEITKKKMMWRRKNILAIWDTSALTLTIILLVVEHVEKGELVWLEVGGSIPYSHNCTKKICRTEGKVFLG